MVARTIIAQYMKEMRKKYKLTQVDLSEKAGVGLRFVRELEQGKTTLRLDKVNKVFELFGSECGPVPMKREGDDVKGGEAIALVGNTGQLSTGPHLHFELWHKGKAVNPELYIVF